MSNRKNILLFFPFFDVNITVNDKELFDLIISQFPDSVKRKPRHLPPAKLHVSARYLKTPYSKLPRSVQDCFREYPIFYNRFNHNDFVHLDVGPRTLRTSIEYKTKTITSYIATPIDFERNLLFDLTFFQPLKHLLLVNGLCFLHASCVANEAGGVLFSGRSGSGKTTLALALSKNGFNYVCDEEVILYQGKNGIECAPFLSRPKISWESFAIFPELKDKTVKGSLKKEKILIDIDKNPTLVRTYRTVPRVLIFPRFTKKSTTRLEPVTKQIAFKRLAKEEVVSIKFVEAFVEKEHSLSLAHLIRQVKTFRLYYNDQDLERIPQLLTRVLDR